jgi:hypothetical protein
MMHRQLQWVWTFKIRIGTDASLCGTSTAHSLSADTKIVPQDVLGAIQEFIDARAYPSLMSAHLERMEVTP